MSKYTREQTIKMLEDVVKGREAYVYEYPEVKVVDFETDEVGVEKATDCLYATPDGQPSCIVGHVLAQNDPDLFERVREIEYDGYNEGDGYVLNPMCVEGIFGVREAFEEDALAVLQRAQDAQDGALPWGVALDRARTAVAA